MDSKYAGRVRYVALDDSYSTGTSVSAAERWPNQLVAALGNLPPALELVANLGVDGYTSGDVIKTELPRLDALRPEFITLLVGVNDVVQGVPAETYRANLTLHLAIQDLVSVARYHVEVDVTHGPARGRTICESHPRRLARAGRTSNVDVGIHIERARFEQVLIDAFGRLP